MKKIPQEPLGLLKFNAVFKFLGQFTIRCIHHFFQEDVDNFEKEHITKHAKEVGGAVPSLREPYFRKLCAFCQKIKQH